MNADDFGLSPGVNAGIADAFKHGILTSATILANAPRFAEAVGLARNNPGLGVGAHLNLMRGRPLSPVGKVPDLVDENGLFRPFRLRRFSPAFLRQAEIEYRRQIEKTMESGLSPTHIDFEKHHAWQGPLYSLACRIAAEYGIPAVRSLKEPVIWSLRRLGWPGWRRVAMAGALRTGVAFRNTRGARLATTDHFLGQTHIGILTEPILMQIVHNLPSGTSELMVHPGLAEPVATQGDMGESWLGGARQAEHAALVSPRVKAAVGEYEINLISYKELAGMA